MLRTIATGFALLLFLAGASLTPADAQTKDDTLVYALQSDVDSWDPPNSVLREAIILGYNVFDHLAVRDLKTRRVVPNPAFSPFDVARISMLTMAAPSLFPSNSSTAFSKPGATTWMV